MRGFARPILRCVAPGGVAGRLAALLLAVLCGVVLAARPALALKAIEISPDQGRIEITTLGDLYEARGDSL